MTLKERITDDMKTAMRAKDTARLGTIRLLQAAMKQKEVDERVTLDDVAVMHADWQRDQAVRVRLRVQGSEQEQQQGQASHAGLPRGMIDCDSLPATRGPRTDAR